MSEKINEINIEGIVLEIFPIISGEGKRGPYRLRYVTISYNRLKHQSITRVLCWDLMTESMEVNDHVKLRLTIEARKRSDGNYFDSITAIRVVNLTKRTLAVPSKIKPIKNFIET